MIPAIRPHVARFKHTDPIEHFTDMPIIAWDDDGEPLVLDQKAHHLVNPRRRWNNFHDITEGEGEVVAVLPGQGYTAEYEGKTETWRWPILGWLVYSDGEVKPIETDSEGYVDESRRSGNLKRIVEPGAGP